MLGGVAWFGALSLLIGVFQRIVTKSFSSAVFGRSPYQFPFVSMFHSCSLHIPHSRHFDFQVFIFRELLKFFRWPIYIWWDGDVLKVQYLVVWSLIIISGLLCLWALSVLIDSTSQRIATMSFSHFSQLLLVGVHNRNFDVTVSADTLMVICSNIVMSG